MMARGKPYTRLEIIKAIRLHEIDGLTWAEVGERLGRSGKSVELTTWKLRTGRWSDARPNLAAARLRQAVDVLRSGGSGAELARMWGVSGSRVHKFLTAHGIGPEERAQMRRELRHDLDARMETALERILEAAE